MLNYTENNLEVETWTQETAPFNLLLNRISFPHTARWCLRRPSKGKEFHHPQVGAPLLFTWILGDTLPARDIYCRRSKTFSFISSTCEASKRKRTEITATFFPLGQMVAVYTSWPLLIQSTLLSLPLDQLEEIPQQGPQELEQTIPWGKEENPICEESVK